MLGKRKNQNYNATIEDNSLVYELEIDNHRRTDYTYCFLYLAKKAKEKIEELPNIKSIEIRTIPRIIVIKFNLFSENTNNQVINLDNKEKNIEVVQNTPKIIEILNEVFSNFQEVFKNKKYIPNNQLKMDFRELSISKEVITGLQNH